MSYPDRISSDHRPQAHLTNYHVSEMPQLPTSDTSGVNMALATSSIAVHARYCYLTGFASSHVFIDKEGSFYTARIKQEGLKCTGTGQFIGKGGWLPTHLTDTFTLYQLDNRE